MFSLDLAVALNVFALVSIACTPLHATRVVNLSCLPNLISTKCIIVKIKSNVFETTVNNIVNVEEEEEEVGVFVVFTRESSYCFQRVLAIAHPSHGWISQKRCKLGSPNLHRRLPGRL